MKSAYELAMERLAASEGVAAPVSAETKQRLAEIDERYRAKIAEREVFLQQKLVECRSRGEYKEAEAIQKQLSHERARLEEEREAAKEKLRSSQS